MTEFRMSIEQHQIPHVLPVLEEILSTVDPNLEIGKEPLPTSRKVLVRIRFFSWDQVKTFAECAQERGVLNAG